MRPACSWDEFSLATEGAKGILLPQKMMPVAFGSIKLLEVGANQIGFGSGFDQYLNSVPPKLCRRTSACLSFFVFGKDIMNVIVLYVLYDVLLAMFFFGCYTRCRCLSLIHTTKRPYAKSTHIRQTFGNSLLPQPFWMLWFQSYGCSYIHYPCVQQVCLFSNPNEKGSNWRGISMYIYICRMFLQEDRARRNQKCQVLLTWTSEKQLMVPKSGR